MRAVEDAAGRVTETAEEKADPDRDVRDVRQREQENSVRLEEAPQSVQQDFGTRQMLQDVAGHDHVERLFPRSPDLFEEVAGQGLVEERRALLEDSGYRVLRIDATAMPFELAFPALSRPPLAGFVRAAALAAARLWPTLFGYQFVYEARPS